MGGSYVWSALMRRFFQVVGVVAMLQWTGISAGAGEGSGLVGGQPFKHLPGGAITDYQLGGAYPPPAGVNVVARDSTAAPARGLYNICYVNGFQSQPGAAWPREFLVTDKKGEAVGRPGLAGRISSERFFGGSSACNLETPCHHDIQLCSSRVRCRGVRQPRFLHEIERRTQAERRSRFRGLVGARRSRAGFGRRAEEYTTAVRPGAREDRFDFAVSEECHRYDECSEYTRYYGDKVINIEYTDNLRGRFADVCAIPTTPRTRCYVIASSCRLRGRASLFSLSDQSRMNGPIVAAAHCVPEAARGSAIAVRFRPIAWAVAR